MADKELNEAIAKAEEQLKNGNKEEKKEEKSEEKPEVKLDAEEEKEPGEEEEEQQSDELSETEKDESLRLYKALKDPKTAGPIIAALAQQTGILNGKETTKTEEKRQVKDVKAILGEALGEYKFLADKLGPAIEEILSQERQTQETKFAEIQQHRVESEVVTATEKLARETKGESRKLEAAMSKLAEEMPIGNMNVETYIRRLYTVALGDHAKASPKAIADKIRRNANDSSSRLQGTRGNESERVIPKEKMNINKSVEWALGELSKANK